MIFLSFVKMHFSYVKSKVLRRWLNILRNYVHSRTFFTPKIHPPPTTRPARPLARSPRPPGQPPDPARHPTQPATTRPATPPCLPAFPDSLASGMTASRALRRASAVLILLQWLCVWGASQRATPSNILHIPSNILCIPSKKICIPSFYVPHLLFYVPPPIVYVNLTCGAVDTQSERTLPPGVVNCGVEPLFLVKTWRGT